MVVASTRRCKLELMLLLLLVACGSDGMGPAASPAALRPWTSFATTGIPRTRTPDQSLRPDGWIPGSTGSRRAATHRRLRALAIARGFRPRRAQSNIRQTSVCWRAAGGAVGGSSDTRSLHPPVARPAAALARRPAWAENVRRLAVDAVRCVDDQPIAVA